MDRELDPGIRKRRLIRRWGIGLAAGLVLTTVVVYGGSWLQPSISRTRIRTGIVERGSLEATVQASGVVVSANERVISSPVEARVKRVLLQPGQVIHPGQAILELDTAATRLELEQLQDDLARKNNDRDELSLSLASRIENLSGQIEIQRLDRELAEYQLSQRTRLAGDGLISEEELKEAEVAVKKAKITLRRLEEDVVAAKRTTDAQLEGLSLEAASLRKQLEQTQRNLDLADTQSELGGVLTWVVEDEGTTVQRGEVIARIADLDSFRVEATVSDAYASRLSNGQPVRVRIDDDLLEARLATVLPAIESGTLRFIVELEDGSHAKLRQNLRVDVYVVTSRRQDVLRVNRGPFAQSEGLDRYAFVIEDDQANRTKIRLGLTGHEHIEIVEGLSEGDEVILSDMRDYQHARQVRLKP